MAIKPGSLGRPKGPTHRTNEERNAQTRAKLLKAAIHCLSVYGYAATSVTLVAEMARLSRGAVLYQFGSKVELMLAVAEHVVREQNKLIKDRVQQFEPGRDRFIGLTDATWESVNQPGSLALLEIMLASRSDPELGDRFPAVASDLAESQRKGAWSLAKLAGITDQKAVDEMSQLHRAAMEGMSLRALFTVGGADALEPMFQRLREYKVRVTDELIAKARREDAQDSSDSVNSGQSASSPEKKAS